MTIKTDPADVDTTIGPDGMQRDYLVLTQEERAKGFVRPVRRGYRHVGIAAPRYSTRDLTPDERERYGSEGYVKFEEYPAGAVARGRFWTQAQLDKVGVGCGMITVMGTALAETYARQPGFYSGTFCAYCGTHFPVGPTIGEFVWTGPEGARVGT